MFADDCVLYMSGNKWNVIRPKLQSDLDAFALWCHTNALSLNISKTIAKTMIFGNRHKLGKITDPLPLHVQGHYLQFVTKYNYLGIILDSELTLELFYKSIIKKINYKIYTLRKIRKYISFEIASQIYKQTILPFFDYGGFIDISFNKEKKKELQIMQNDILRICNGSRLLDKVSIEKLHKKAKLLAMEQRRDKQLLLLMYIYSNDDNVQAINERNTCSANKFVFKTESKIGTKYENSPFYKGTKLWNVLTREVQYAENKWVFKTCINKMYKSYKNEL